MRSNSHEADVTCTMRDLVFLLLCVLLLALLMVNPQKKKQEVAFDPLCTIFMEAYWQDGLAVDIDLWAKDPSGRPVGYSNPYSGILGLNRDDRGTLYDVIPLNYEFICSRGIVPGEYIINVKFFSGIPLTPAHIVVSVKKSDGLSRILYKTVDFKAVGEEITVARITFDKDGNVTAMNEVPIKISSGHLQ